MKDCIFCKIRDKEIPTEFIYRDEDVMVFRDLHPLKPIHLLIVPTKHIEEFTAIEDDVVFVKIGRVIQQMIAEQDLQDRGYRIHNNGGGFQDIDHLHFHLIGPMGKPR